MLFTTGISIHYEPRPKGIKEIAQRVHYFATVFTKIVENMGHVVKNRSYFDTVQVCLKQGSSDTFIANAVKAGINVRKIDQESIGVSFDETINKKDLIKLLHLFGQGVESLLESVLPSLSSKAHAYPTSLNRTSSYLTHKVFNSYHSVSLCLFLGN